MSTTKPAGAAGRRAKFLATTSVLLLAVSAVCVFGVLLASRHPVRWDMTASREHQLSERTQKVVENLKGPHEIVVVANASTVDPRALERTRSVLDAIARSSKQVSTTFIDAGSARGHAQLDEVLTRLTSRYQDGLTKAAKSVADANAAARSLAGDIELLAGQLQSVQDSIADAGGDANITTLKRFFADSASVLRVSSHELTQACVNSEKLLGAPVPGTNIIPTARAASALRQPGSSVLRQLEPIQQTTAAIAGIAGATPVRGVPKEIQQQSTPIGQSLQRARDQAARLLLDLDQVPRTPLESVANVVANSSAVLVIGPPSPPSAPSPTPGSAPASGSAPGPTPSTSQGGGLTAVDLATLLPPRVQALEGTVQPDLRFRAEELLTGALASLSQPNAPIVCIMHSRPEVNPRFKPALELEHLRDRLALRGIDIVQWIVVDEDSPSQVRQLDPTGSRPVVYVVIPADALGPANDALRSKRLNEATAKLVNEGRPVLISLHPSNLPSYGQVDPAVEFLSALGVRPDTGKVLMRRVVVGNLSGVTPDFRVTSSGNNGVLAQSIQSLPLSLSWVSPIGIDPEAVRGPQLRVEPIVSIDDDGQTWGESEWSRVWMPFWVRATNQPGPQSLPDAPPFTESVRDNNTGPWVAAVAVERASSGTTPARAIVVGTSGWFFDVFTQPREEVDGRSLLLNPGNLEFFEAAVYWLAGQDQLIARSADAQAAALIPDLSDRTQLILRWVLIAGLPLIVLLLGVLYRVTRG